MFGSARAGGDGVAIIIDVALLVTFASTRRRNASLYPSPCKREPIIFSLVLSGRIADVVDCSGVGVVLAFVIMTTEADSITGFAATKGWRVTMELSTSNPEAQIKPHIVAKAKQIFRPVVRFQ